MSKITIALPFIVIQVASTMPKHEMKSFNELPDGHEEYTNQETGKKFTLHFWVSEGVESIADYDEQWAKDKIKEALTKVLQSGLEGVNHNFDFMHLEAMELCEHLLSSIPNKNTSKPVAKAAFTSTGNGNGEYTTLAIPAGKHCVVVDVHAGSETPDSTPKNFIEKLKDAVCLEDKSNWYTYCFSRGDKSFTAVIKFKAYDHGDWFSSETLFCTINDAIDDHLHNLVAKFAASLTWTRAVGSVSDSRDN